jgi:hypothetical protein
MKKIIFTGLLILVALILVSSNGDTVNYGKIYIKNNAPWDIIVTADVKDEWDNVTNTDWTIAKESAEVLGNIITLSNMKFKIDVQNEVNLPSWLQDKTFYLNMPTKQQGKDLVIYIAKSRFGNRWDIKPQYVSNAQIEYSGQAGYSLTIGNR